MNRVIVIGGGEHARVVMDIAVSNGWDLCGYTDIEEDSVSTEMFKAECMNDDAALTFLKSNNDVKIVFGIGNDNKLKKRLLEQYKAFENRWTTLIDKSASVSKSASIEPGTVILAKSVVQAGASIGKHCIVNSSSVVEHDCVLGDFTHIAPGSILGGGVLIGKCSLIGIGAKVRDHLKIGSGVTVGTGAVVVSDIPDDLTVVGIPAIPIANQKPLDLDQLLLKPEVSLHGAMEAISQNGVTIALITDDDRKLLGILTDGDIRKALLHDEDMCSQVSKFMKTDFISVHERLSRKSALDIMAANFIEHLPVLDNDGRIVDLHFLRGMLHKPSLDLDVVIMAGGKGTRLLPLTEDIPKPMVPVAGKPILEHIIIHLVGQGVKRVNIAVNHLKSHIIDYFGNGSQFGIQIDYLEEEKPLGTGGALTLLKDPLRPVMVMNSDLITQVNVANLIDTHQTGENLVTVGVRSYSHTVPYGVMNIEGKRVVSISEKPKLNYLINAGIYLIDHNLLKCIPEQENYPLTRLITHCLETDQKVGYHLVEGDWIDVGQHGDLARARGVR